MGKSTIECSIDTYLTKNTSMYIVKWSQKCLHWLNDDRGNGSYQKQKKSQKRPPYPSYYECQQATNNGKDDSKKYAKHQH